MVQFTCKVEKFEICEVWTQLTCLAKDMLNWLCAMKPRDEWLAFPIIMIYQYEGMDTMDENLGNLSTLSRDIIQTQGIVG